MKKENDKTLKILLKCGQVITMYADDETIYKIKNDYCFVPMRDNGNQIFVSMSDITAFEILDERQPEENPQAPRTESPAV